MTNSILNNFALNKHISVTKLSIGREKTPILIIDNFIDNHHKLIEEAGDGSLFVADNKNYYPGKRMLINGYYPNFILKHYLPLFADYFGFELTQTADNIISTFAISDQTPQKLRPIQMLPHVDTTLNNQLAIVHYLCDTEHGGTSFYRHKASQFEVITAERLVGYSRQLKKEAMANQIHLNPRYINGSNTMFEQIYSVEAKMNRAIIYPSNILHSGNINPAMGLSSNPQKGRLTISSFIEIKLTCQE